MEMNRKTDKCINRFPTCSLHHYLAILQVSTHLISKLIPNHVGCELQK